MYVDKRGALEENPENLIQCRLREAQEVAAERKPTSPPPNSLHLLQLNKKFCSKDSWSICFENTRPKNYSSHQICLKKK